MAGGSAGDSKMENVTASWPVAIAVVLIFVVVGYLAMDGLRAVYDLAKKWVCRRDGHDWSYMVEPENRPGAIYQKESDLVSADVLPSRRVFLICDRCGYESHVDVLLSDFAHVAEDVPITNDRLGERAMELAGSLPAR